MGENYKLLRCYQRLEDIISMLLQASKLTGPDISTPNALLNDIQRKVNRGKQTRSIASLFKVRQKEVSSNYSDPGPNRQGHRQEGKVPNARSNRDVQRIAPMASDVLETLQPVP